MKDFRELKVWAKAHEVTLHIYKATACFPKEEIYGLTNQMRRASVSIGSNIAEGCGRASDADFARFMQMAMGSASELEYQLILAKDLQLMDESNFTTIQNNLTECRKMLNVFIQKLRANS